MFGAKAQQIQDLEAAIAKANRYNKELTNEITRLKEEDEEDALDQYCPNFYIVTPTKGKPFTVVADGVYFADHHYTFFDQYPGGPIVALLPESSVKSVIEDGVIYVPAKPLPEAKAVTDKKPAPKTTKKDPSI